MHNRIGYVKKYCYLFTFSLLGCGGASKQTQAEPAVGPLSCPQTEIHELGTRDLSAELSFTVIGGGTLVAWKTGMSGLRVAHATGAEAPRTDELFLSDSARPTPGGPLVAWSGDRYLVGWLEEEPGAASSLRVRRYHEDFSEEGEVVPVVDGEVTGEAVLSFLDGRFVALWASGPGRSLLRHATIDPHTAAARKRIVGAGAGPFDELAAEPYADGLLISWRGGRIVVEADGAARGDPSETGASERDPRPPSWTQNAVPALPESARAFGRGLPRGETLLVPWLEESRVVYGAFAPDGTPVGGPWAVTETDAGPPPVQLGIGPVGDRIGVVYFDGGGTTVKIAVFAPCR